MAYATASQLNDYSDTDYSESRAEAVLSYASTIIDSFTDRTFTPVSEIDHEEREYVSYQRVVFIDDAVEIDTVEKKDKFDEDYEEIDENTEWKAFPLNAGKKYPYTFIRLDQDYPIVRVKAKYTYAEELPKDIELVTIELADLMLSGTTSDKTVSSRKIGDYSISYDTSRTMDVERVFMILSTYRKQQV